jgi:tetratricopeptide (TPR) repeat protein
MKNLLITLALIITSISLFAQDYKTQFDQYCQQGDTTKQKEILEAWEKEDPHNAELYASYFNHYLIKSRENVVAFLDAPSEEETMIIEDSIGEAIGYLGSETIYHPVYLDKAFEKIDDGIKRYPNRLDMRFGKIYMLGEVEKWDEFTVEIIKTILYSIKNENQWTWTYNEPRSDGKDFLLAAIQEYQYTLFSTGEDSLLKNMRYISELILQLQPNHVESMSNIAATYLLSGEYDKGLEILLEAEKFAPSDAIVLSNIARAYIAKGDNLKAMDYYQRAIPFADEEMSELILEQIEELKR